MAEKEKKPNPDKKSEVKRDKNGKFVSGKADDGTVKIKVVKDNPKEESNSKESSDKAKEKPNGEGIFIHLTGTIPFFDFEFPRFPEFPKFPEFTSFEQEKNKAFKVLERFEKEISDRNPDKLTFGDKDFYSTDSVCTMLNDTILTCARVAAEEEVKKEQKAEEDKRIAEAQRQLRIRRIGWKMSKIAANIILGVFVLGLGAASAFGLWQLGKMIFR